jgi:hypothetical protein
MYDELFEQPAVIARHRAGPYAESREQFLRQARANGYSPKTLVRMAWALRIVAEAVHREGGRITSKRLRECASADPIQLRSTAAIRKYNQVSSSTRGSMAAWPGCVDPGTGATAEVRGRTACIHRVHACGAGPFSDDNCRSRRAAALVVRFLAVFGTIASYSDYCPRGRIP